MCDLCSHGFLDPRLLVLLSRGLLRWRFCFEGHTYTFLPPSTHLHFSLFFFVTLVSEHSVKT